MKDYAEHWEAIKQLHRTYYQARLQHDMNKAAILALKMAKEAQDLGTLTVTEALELCHGQKTNGRD